MPPASCDPLACLAAYQTWLARQPLATHTRRTYRGRVAQFCAYLTQTPADGDPFGDPHGRDFAVRDYQTHLKAHRRVKPASINLSLAAIDHFYRFLGLGPAHVRREPLAPLAPRALTPEEQKRWLRAVVRCASARDRAIARLGFYTGLRLAELSALDVADVQLSARKGLVTVRAGKGGASRAVPLNAEVRAALTDWLQARTARFPQPRAGALWLNPQGERLSDRAIDHVVRRLGRQAGIMLSAHTLRHTCLTTLVRHGHDLVLVAEIAGHRRLETTRRYSLPSADDRARAMEGLQVEY